MPSLPCSNCGADLTFLEQYQRHFCYQCGQYAPEGYGAQGPKVCSTCGGILSHVAMYDRFFCYRCQQYSAADVGPIGPARVVAAAPSTPPESEPRPATEPEARAEAGTVHDDSGPDEYIVVERPTLSRELIEGAKKSILMDLCKAYDLDPSGTKDQLRERLLSYVAERQAAEEVIEVEPEPVADAGRQGPEAGGAPEPAAEPPKAAEAAPFVAPAVVVGPLPAPEPVREPARVEEVRAEPAPMPGPTREVSSEAIEGFREPARPEERAVRVEHPCPSCGRELDYIAQYDRWYCHYCKSYAPRRKFKHVCPSCGATLRWIDRYGRWWCDAEQSYASADLPGPGAVPEPVGRLAEPLVTAAAPAAAQPVIHAHRHRSPGAGIRIAGFGVFLWVLYQLLVEVPRATSISIGIAIPSNVAFLMQFTGLLLLGAGVLVGLSALRHRL